MIIQENENLFQNETAFKEKSFVGNYGYPCRNIGISVVGGKVTAKGKITENDSFHPIGFLNLLDGKITDTAENGLFTVLLSDTLFAVEFSGVGATAYIKYIY